MAVQAPFIETKNYQNYVISLSEQMSLSESE